MGRLENFEKYMDAIVEGKERIEFPLRVGSDLLDERKAENGMTREKAIKLLVNATYSDEWQGNEDLTTARNMAIKALEQEPCDDAVSRQAVLEMAYDMSEIDGEHFTEPCMVVDVEDIQNLPSVSPQEQIGHCKDCKCFEYDSVANVDGVPLIVAHEICNKWGDGCKTKEDGYCFLFEPRERSDKE